MTSTSKRIKVGFLVVFGFALTAWLVSGSASEQAIGAVFTNEQTRTVSDDDNYVGSETCAACHETQFKSFEGTKHGKLHTISSWKGKVVGCESCHGPGKAHVEAGNATGIISFKKLDAKTTAETCLACHAGKENHNNFRRGEHWRNNIGCTDCHTAHGPDPGSFRTGSATIVGDVAAQKPGQATRAMLRSNEPQLCISCHTETKAQFSKPFRHRVLEGAMNCSDCHNPHGGFEQKQAKLAIGADAACVKCHSNKQGPFVFEHAPLKTEGCAACHTPHGSANPKMLKRNSVRQLCLECHSSITEQFAPDVPSFHNQAVLRYQSCTTCHSAIHGSNTNSVFFR
jgi:predicted CXXCH cytochrome family protein